MRLCEALVVVAVYACIACSVEAQYPGGGFPGYGGGFPPGGDYYGGRVGPWGESDGSGRFRPGGDNWQRGAWGGGNYPVRGGEDGGRYPTRFRRDSPFEFGGGFYPGIRPGYGFPGRDLGDFGDIGDGLRG